ncbi:glutathione S-transferase [Acidiphilium sp. PA]|uniref:glutathione S-transferase n=1 Tax=Acidiphilium sp. PA TaxID=2871705 RepID=UPI0022436EF5|nr:glutathione S-transferase [Acidiphilium sp. PA]MCW8306857.1 glutathione S-transferase [Acidiphilium sp. PA]
MAPQHGTTPNRQKSPARLAISSRNYSSWCLRGFLLARLSGIDFVVEPAAANDPQARAELLMRTSSILLPCLIDGDVTVWDTLAIAEYLNETYPKAAMLPDDPISRARCRSISGEMHSGFAALRASLPMNIRANRPSFTVWSGAQADIDRITTIWRDCFTASPGPYLFGPRPCIADAMFAPVASRFQTYDVPLDPVCTSYVRTIFAWPDMVEWIAEAETEADTITELDLEF